MAGSPSGLQLTSFAFTALVTPQVLEMRRTLSNSSGSSGQRSAVSPARVLGAPLAPMWKSAEEIESILGGLSELPLPLEYLRREQDSAIDALIANFGRASVAYSADPLPT